jgi:hypothetical protein
MSPFPTMALSFIFHMSVVSHVDTSFLVPSSILPIKHSAPQLQRISMLDEINCNDNNGAPSIADAGHNNQDHAAVHAPNQNLKMSKLKGQIRIMDWAANPFQIYKNRNNCHRDDDKDEDNEEEMLLRPLNIDEHMIVLRKPSGIRSVPGPGRNPSLVDDGPNDHPSLGHGNVGIDRVRT